MTGAPTGRAGFRHETGLYGSDRELLDLVGPFLQEGLDAGEPTVVAFTPRNTALVRDAFGPGPAIEYVPAGQQYARPAAAIVSYQQRFAELAAHGPPTIRVVAEVPPDGIGTSWQEWLRYEAVAEEAFGPYPVWAICSYDLRVTPDPVVEDVLAAHRYIAGDGGHHGNPRFDDPAALVGRRLQERPALHPMQASPPFEVLLAPTPSSARRVAADAARHAGLDPLATEDAIVVASELVTNSYLHGSEPVTLALWSDPGRVLMTVTDGGHGPTDVLVGLLGPSGGVVGGRGLWLTNQLTSEVTLDYHDDGFTIRALVGG
jgi:anti-sigma regulatory factor (Ser/Thr protein kinase)